MKPLSPWIRILMLAASALASPCGGAPEQTPPAPAAEKAGDLRPKLIGSWSCTDKPPELKSFEETYTLREDGSGAYSVSADTGQGPVKISLEIRWTLDGRTLNWEVLRSDNPKLAPVGKKKSAEVIAVSETEFRYRSAGVERVAKKQGQAVAGKAVGYQADAFITYAQKAEDLEKRIKDTDAFGELLKALRDECAAFFKEETTPEDIAVVVIIRSGNRMKVWFDSSRKDAPVVDRELLRKKLEALKAPAVEGGPLVFALSGKIAGGGPGTFGVSGDDPGKRLPMPEEWREAAKGKEWKSIDDIAGFVWPEK